MRMLSALCSGLLLAALVGPVQAAESDKLLPSDTNAVFTVNVKQLIDSALFKKLDDKFSIKEALKKNAEAKQAMEAVGLDPMKDIDQMVVAATGSGKQDEALILVLGKFNRTKLEEAAVKGAKDGANNLKIIKEGGYTLYEMNNKRDGQTVYAAIVNESTLAASPKKDFVVDALDRNAGKKKSALKKELAELLAKADSKQSMTIVGVTAGLGGQAADLADKLKSVVGGINVTDDVKMNFDLAAKDEAGAKEVAKQLDEGLGQVKAFVGIMAAQQKQLAPVIDILGTMKVEAKGSTVVLKGEVTKDILDKLIKMLPQQ